MDRPHVLLRADASERIGHGHVMRCLALAEALRACGAVALFAQTETSGDASAAIRAAGCELLCLPPGLDVRADAAHCAARMQERGGVGFLVLDHYGLGSAWVQALRGELAGRGCRMPRLLVIDDLANRPLEGDLLLDQNWYAAGAARYADCWPAGRPMLLGPGYALLRPEFRQWREAALLRRDGEVRRVILAFGGSDPARASGACLAALAAALADDLAAGRLQIELVMGAAAAHGAELARAYAAVPGIAVACAVPDMARRFAAADLFVGAGGSMSWERACLGLAGITVALADNQEPLCRELAAAGEGLHLGPWRGDAAQLRELVEAVLALRAAPARVLAMGQALAARCDGAGAARVAAALLQTDQGRS